MINMLKKILQNVVSSDDDKYRKLSLNNAKLSTFSEYPEFMDVLLETGFRKKVVEFKAYFVLPHLPSTKKAFLMDLIAELSQLADNIPQKRDNTVFLTMQQRKELHRKYVDRMIAQAEEDRLDKLERENRRLAKIRNRQEEDKREMERQMELQRRLLANPPRPLHANLAEASEGHVLKS